MVSVAGERGPFAVFLPPAGPRVGTGHRRHPRALACAEAQRRDAQRAQQRRLAHDRRSHRALLRYHPISRANGAAAVRGNRVRYPRRLQRFQCRRQAARLATVRVRRADLLLRLSLALAAARLGKTCPTPQRVMAGVDRAGAGGAQLCARLAVVAIHRDTVPPQGKLEPPRHLQVFARRPAWAVRLRCHHPEDEPLLQAPAAGGQSHRRLPAVKEPARQRRLHRPPVGERALFIWRPHRPAAHGAVGR